MFSLILITSLFPFHPLIVLVPSRKTAWVLLLWLEKLFSTIGNTTAVIRALSEEMILVWTNQVAKISNNSKQTPIVLLSLGSLVHITRSSHRYFVYSLGHPCFSVSVRVWVLSIMIDILSYIVIHCHTSLYISYGIHRVSQLNTDDKILHINFSIGKWDVVMTDHSVHGDQLACEGTGLSYVG